MVTTAHSELKAIKNTRKDYFSDLQNGNVWFPVQLRLPNPKGITKVSRGPSAEGPHGKFPIAKTLQRCGVPRADTFQLTVGTLFWQNFYEEHPTDLVSSAQLTYRDVCEMGRELFLTRRWCQAFSFLPGTVPQKKTPMSTFCPEGIYCTMRQRSSQARFSVGLRSVRVGFQACEEGRMSSEEAKG